MEKLNQVVTSKREAHRCHQKERKYTDQSHIRDEEEIITGAQKWPAIWMRKGSKLSSWVQARKDRVHERSLFSAQEGRRSSGALEMCGWGRTTGEILLMETQDMGIFRMWELVPDNAVQLRWKAVCTLTGLGVAIQRVSFQGKDGSWPTDVLTKSKGNGRKEEIETGWIVLSLLGKHS